MTLWLRLKNDRIDCRHVNFQGDDERFSCFVAARRQTAANLSAYFQMAALCRDAATPIADDEAAAGAPVRFAFRQVQTSRRRLAMTRQAVGDFSSSVGRRPG